MTGVLVTVFGDARGTIEVQHHELVYSGDVRMMKDLVAAYLQPGEMPEAFLARLPALFRKTVNVIPYEGTMPEKKNTLPDGTVPPDL